MPATVSGDWLVLAIIAGAAAAGGLLVFIAACRITRAVAGQRTALADERVRPEVLSVLTGRQGIDALAAARGARGKAVDRVALGFLSEVEGEARERLTRLLDQRGTLGRLLRQSARRRPYQRALAASRLGDLAAASAGNRLAQLIRTDRDPRVRIAAARALGRAQAPDAATALLESQRRSDPVPAGIVAAALLDLGPRAAPALRETIQAGQPAVSPAEQILAAEVLGALKDLQAWEKLATCTQSHDPLMRMTAVRSLGYLGLREPVGIVAGRLVSDEDPVVRTAAAWALGRIRDPASVAALRGGLADPDHRVASAAAPALAALGTPGERVLKEVMTSGGAGSEDAREALARLPWTVRAALPPVMWPAVSSWPAPAHEARSAR
jgi:HEAT repeat protein